MKSTTRKKVRSLSVCLCLSLCVSHKHTRTRNTRTHTEDDSLDEDKPEPPGKWYFLWCSSFGEMLLHIAIYGVALFLLYSFLHSRGYWQRFVQPVLDIIWYWIGPGATKLWSFVAPVGDPLVELFKKGFNWLGKVLTVEPATAEQVRKAANKASSRDGM